VVLKDYECEFCGVNEITVESGVHTVPCEQCGRDSIILPSAPRIVGEVRRSFNPHYLDIKEKELSGE